MVKGLQFSLFSDKELSEKLKTNEISPHLQKQKMGIGAIMYYSMKYESMEMVDDHRMLVLVIITGIGVGMATNI